MVIIKLNDVMMIRLSTMVMMTNCQGPDTSFDDFVVKRSIDKAQRLMLVQHVEPISAINLARGSAQLWLSEQCH